MPPLHPDAGMAEIVPNRDGTWTVRYSDTNLMGNTMPLNPETSRHETQKAAINAARRKARSEDRIILNKRDRTSEIIKQGKVGSRYQ